MALKMVDARLRLLALCAGAAGVGLLALQPYLASFALLGTVPLDVAGAYTAARLGRRGVLWFFLGLPLAALPFLLLAALPPGRRSVRPAGAHTPGLLTAGSLAACALCGWLCSREPAFWADAETGKSVAGYERYLTRWPAGPHAREAQLRTAELRQEQAGRGQRKTERQAWVDRVRASGELKQLFAPTHGTDARPFPPRFFLIFLDDTDLMSHLTVWFRHENLASRIEDAKTLVFVQTHSWESGRYEYPGGKDAGPAKSWTVDVALVDAEDFGRRRVLEARSSSPPKIKGRTQYGGRHTVDGIERDGTENTSSLLHKLLERVLEQNKTGAVSGH